MSPEPVAPGAAPAAVPVDGPLSPELVRSEVGRAMNDKTHPHYQHFHGWPSDAGAAWKTALYARIPGASAPLEIGQGGIEVTARPTTTTAEPAAAPATQLSAEDVTANAAADEELRREWGADFDTKNELARAHAQWLEDVGGRDALEAMKARAVKAKMSVASIKRYLASEEEDRRRQ